jgi:hypothetical protein
MGFVCRALFGMKIKFNGGVCAAILFAIICFAAAVVRAQQAAAGHASDFSSVEYFEAPHAQQMKSRMSGAEASPQPGGLLDIKKLKLEKFDVDGKLEAVVEAPECVYDSLNGVANSAGHLQMRTGDTNLIVEGDGFLWRQTNEWLTISNHQHTVIDGALESKTVL